MCTRERFDTMGLFDKLFGSYSDRELKRINPIVDKIEKLEPRYQAMSDAELLAFYRTAKQETGGRAAYRVED